MHRRSRFSRRRVRRSVVTIAALAAAVGGTGMAGATPAHRTTPAFTADCSSTTAIAFSTVPVSGSISDPQAAPTCFTFDANASESVHLDAVPTSSNPVPTVTLLDPDGVQIGGGGGLDYSMDTSGTYTIAVSDAAAGSFNVDLVGTDDPAGCTMVSFGQPAVSGSISLPGQSVCFQYSVPYSAWVILHVDSAPTTLGAEFYFPEGGVRGGSCCLGPGQSIGGQLTVDYGTQTALVYAAGESPATGTVGVTLGELALTQWSGAPGSKETFFASGFQRHEKFAVTYETGLSDPATVVLCRKRVPVTGQPRCQGKIPTGALAGAPGPHLITITGQKSGHVGEVSFVLT